MSATLFRTYTITLYLSGMGAPFNSVITADNSAEAATIVAGIQRAMNTDSTIATYTKNMCTLIAPKSVVMVQCVPALTLDDVKTAEEDLDL